MNWAASQEPGAHFHVWSVCSSDLQVSCVLFWFQMPVCFLTAWSHRWLSERWLLCYTAGEQENSCRIRSDWEPDLLLHCKILPDRLTGHCCLLKVCLKCCAKPGASAVVSKESSGQSKQAAWQRSLSECKEAGRRVVSEKGESERSQSGKPSFANPYSVS